MKLTRTLPAAVILFGLCGMVVAVAAKRHAARTSGEFDYYMLSFSWAIALDILATTPRSAEWANTRALSFTAFGRSPMGELRRLIAAA